MRISAMILNNAEYVKGYDDAIAEVDRILWHTERENLIEELKEWVADQSRVVEQLNINRNTPEDKR